MDASAKLHGANGDKPGFTEGVSNPHHSPVNPRSVTGFQPTGGAFKTVPVSPKVSCPVLYVIIVCDATREAIIFL